MWRKTRLTTLCGIDLPIVQAGMAGGPTTPDLVASVCEAGALGTLGAGYLTPQAMRQAIREIRAKTKRPFAVNLFVPEHPIASETDIEHMHQALSVYRQALGMDNHTYIASRAVAFAAQVDVLEEENVPIFSFTFGIPEPGVLARLRKIGIVCIGTATTVREALCLQDAGVDAVVCQGSEAGGHRGTFASPFASALIGTMSLVPQIVDAVHIPVIASGGIADGRGLIAAHALGADGVQMGTAFLTATESGAHDAYKSAVLETAAEDTLITTAFSGKPARGIANLFMKTFSQSELQPLPYPIQNDLTREIRQEAAKQSETAYMSLWAGQSARLSQRISAAEIIAQVCTEGDKVMAALNDRSH